MLPSKEHSDVVVRLLGGESDRHELVLKADCPISPIALGTHGAWAIRGRQVAKLHVMLAWNGKTLSLGPRGGESALLDGFPLGARWTDVRAPSELRFGGARLSIGRRAGPNEETEAPPREEATCIDDGRLQEALRRTRDDEVTCVAEVNVPPEAKRHESLTQEHVHPCSIEVREEDVECIEPASARCSSMPPTIPSEGLIRVPTAAPARPLPVEVARPSQPTMAIPEPPGMVARMSEPSFVLARPSMDSIELGALAVSGEHAADARSTRATESTVVRRKVGSAVETGWRELSLPKKAIALLMIPALVGALFAMRSALAARAHAPAGADRTSATVVAAPSATPAPTPAPAPAPALSTPATAIQKADPPALRDTRTAERRALDTAASGQDAAAADQYAALAAAHPETVAFREATRILRARIATRHD